MVSSRTALQVGHLRMYTRKREAVLRSLVSKASINCVVVDVSALVRLRCSGHSHQQRTQQTTKINPDHLEIEASRASGRSNAPRRQINNAPP
jgi:hypothetical protein